MKIYYKVCYHIFRRLMPPASTNFTGTTLVWNTSKFASTDVEEECGKNANFEAV